MTRFALGFVLAITLASAGWATRSAELCAYLQVLLDKNVIGEEELLQIVDFAEAGQVVNPITPARAKAAPERRIASGVLNRLIPHANASEVLAWAKERLQEKKRTGRERDNVKVETEDLWKDIPAPRISMGRLGYKDDNSDVLACGLSSGNEVVCWGGPEFKAKKVSPILGPVRFLSVWGDRVCVVKADWKLRCWGKVPAWLANADRDLNGTLAMVQGKNHLCVILPNRHVRCVGEPGWPKYPAPYNLGEVKALFTSEEGVCVIKVDLRAACWGDGFERFVPLVPDSLGKVRYLAAEWLHQRCALNAAGTLVCWPEDSETRRFLAVPIQIIDGHVLALIMYHSASIGVDGEISCYGVKGVVPCPELQNLGLVHSMAISEFEICAITLEGKAGCWRPTIGNTWFDKPPLEVPFGGDLDQAVLSRDRAYQAELLAQQKKLLLAKQNSMKTEGVLATKASLEAVVQYANTSTNVSRETKLLWRDPQVFQRFTRNVRNDDSYAVALNANDQLAYWGPGVPGDIAHLNELGPLRTVVTVGSSVCVLSKTGRVGCAGEGAFVPEDLGVVSHLAACASHFCALLADKNALCWGSGEPLEKIEGPFLFLASSWSRENVFALGLNGLVLSFTPSSKDGVQKYLFGGEPARQLAVGLKHACIVDERDSVKCLGNRLDSEQSMSFLVGQGTLVVDDFGLCTADEQGALSCASLAGFSPLVPMLGRIRGSVDESGCALGDDNFIKCWGTEGPYWADSFFSTPMEPPMGGNLEKLALPYGIKRLLLTLWSAYGGYFSGTIPGRGRLAWNIFEALSQWVRAS